MSLKQFSSAKSHIKNGKFLRKKKHTHHARSFSWLHDLSSFFPFHQVLNKFFCIHQGHLSGLIVEYFARRLVDSLFLSGDSDGDRKLGFLKVVTRHLWDRNSKNTGLKYNQNVTQIRHKISHGQPELARRPNFQKIVMLRAKFCTFSEDLVDLPPK